MDRAELAIGDKVLYNGEIYSILHIYESGYIEISKELYKVELVYHSEIQSV